MRNLIRTVRRAKAASAQSGRAMYVWTCGRRYGFRPEPAKVPGRLYVFMVAAPHAERLGR